MGGFAVLLMMATVGITYGWKPDNSGGVEYVIQIAPDELQQLERLGQISSVIDPAVQGHVSRIVIQVGKGPVPRITPRDLYGANRGGSGPASDRFGAAVAISDRAPVPIPEMQDADHAIPIPGMDPMAGKGLSLQAAVMKPQTGDPSSSPGFSLPPSLQNAANTAAPVRSNIDRAGRDIVGNTLQERSAIDSAARGGSTLGNPATARAVIPPPATRTPAASTQPQLPPFTGNNTNTSNTLRSGFPDSGQPAGGFTSELATSRPGGPSTDPIPSRDRTWGTIGPSTEPVGPGFASSPQRNPDPRGQSAATLSGGRDASGLNVGDSFGRLPGGLSVPDPRNTATGSSLQGQFQGQQLQRQQLQGQSAVFTQDSSRTLNQNPATRQDLQALGGTGRTGLGQGFNSDYPPYAGTQANANNLPARQPGNNARLTPEQIAAGAWSVDIYGNPIDREGRPIRSMAPGSTYLSNPVATQPQTPAEGYGRAQSGLATRQPVQMQPQPGMQLPPRQYSDPNLAGSSAPAASLASGAGAFPSAGQSANFGPPPAANYRSGDAVGAVEAGRAIPSVSVAGQTAADPPSLARTRREADSRESSPAFQQASQPLLTWLLLISFVGNVYLIFWMKKLLVRYRDLVAAKRMSSPNAAA